MLIDAARGIIYDRHMFIAQATVINLNLDRFIDTDNIFCITMKIHKQKFTQKLE